MSEQEQQGSQSASSPSVPAPAKVPAAGCDESVRAEVSAVHIRTLAAIVDRLRAGESPASVEWDYELPPGTLRTLPIEQPIEYAAKVIACPESGCHFAADVCVHFGAHYERLRAALSSLPPRSETSQRAGKPADATGALPAGARSETKASASPPPASTGERGGDRHEEREFPRLDPERCNEDVYRIGESMGPFAMERKTADDLVLCLRTVTGWAWDWNFAAGRVVLRWLKPLRASPPPRSSGTTASGEGSR